MRVFLSYRHGDNVSGIIELLQRHNIEIFDSMSDIQHGDSVQIATKLAVKDCDFLLLIYSELNPYITFEAGLAVALNKPIFAVLAGGKEPFFLYDSTYVHAGPTELEKIQFSLELFLNNIKPRTNIKRISNIISKPKFYGGGEPIPMKNYFDVVKTYNSIVDKSESALEDFFKEVFKVYGLNIVKSSSFETDKKEFMPDFSIWNDALSNVLGNPILVEIVDEVNSANLKNLERNLFDMKSSNPANGILVFYDRLQGIVKHDLPNTSTCLFIKVSELVDLLQSNGFAASIRTIRNKIVHEN